MEVLTLSVCYMSEHQLNRAVLCGYVSVRSCVRAGVRACVRACVFLQHHVSSQTFMCCGHCVSVKCPAGKFRVGQDPGTCLDCPLGSYRTARMENCMLCGDPTYWRTDGAGKTSQDDCKCKYMMSEMYME